MNEDILLGRTTDFEKEYWEINFPESPTNLILKEGLKEEIDYIIVDKYISIMFTEQYSGI